MRRRQIHRLPGQTTSPEQARVLAEAAVIGLHRVQAPALADSELEALRRRAEHVLGATDPVTLDVRRRLLSATARHRPADEDERLWRALREDCKALEDTDPVRAAVRASHLSAWRSSRRTSPAVVQAYRDEVDERARVFGRDSYRTAIARGNLSVALRESGVRADVEEALTLAEAEVVTRTEDHGEDHAFTLVAVSLQARALLVLAGLDPEPEQRRERARAALALADRVLGLRELRLGPQHSGTLKALRLRAQCLRLLDDHDRAAALLRQAMAAEELRQDGVALATGALLLAELLADRAAEGDTQAALREASRAFDLLQRHRPASPLTVRAFRLRSDLERRAREVEREDAQQPPEAP